jgi:hypothetical protein
MQIYTNQLNESTTKYDDQTRQLQDVNHLRQRATMEMNELQRQVEEFESQNA